MTSPSPSLRARLALPNGRQEERLIDAKPLYTHGEALAEANRCLYCVDAPCVSACPTGIDIPTFIHKIATDNVRGAARTIFAENLLGASCARACPVEVLCAGACVYHAWDREPIAIGRLQRFATTAGLAKDPELMAKTRQPATGRKVALVGAGPASLAAAGHLALAGHSAVIFERKTLPGGLNTQGIAPYKLHAADALEEIEFILGLGDVRIETGVSVVGESAAAVKDGAVGAPAAKHSAVRPEAGETGVVGMSEATARQVTTTELLGAFDAVFLGLGLGSDSRLGVPGEDGPGVVGATHMIERLKLDAQFQVEGVRRAIVVGGGNTALDAARELAQLGVPHVILCYRRTAAEMSGYAHELDLARQDGVTLLESRQPTRVLREGDTLTGLEVAVTRSGVPVAGTSEVLAADLVVVAIGQSRLTELASAFPGVTIDSNGRVVVDPATQRTGHAKVYAGGDCVNGGAEVVNAAQHGKLAAQAMQAAFQTGALHG